MSTSTHPSWAAVVAAWVEGSNAIYQDPLAPQPVAEAAPPVVAAEASAIEAAWVEGSNAIYQDPLAPQPVVAAEAEVSAPEVEDEPTPSDEALGINTSDLLPARAELVRLTVWIAKLHDEVEGLRTGRETYLKQAHLPVLARRQLQAHDRETKEGIVNFIRKAGKSAELTELARQAEREQLEAALAAAGPAAESARKALAEVDATIEGLERKAAKLELRRIRCAEAAVVELYEPIGAEFCALLRQMTETARRLMAVGVAIGSPFLTYYGSPELTIGFPRFGLASVLDFCREINRSQPGVYADAHVLNRDARSVLEIRNQLLDDPRAKVTLPGGAV